ncbi:hypothetical protein BBJ28_00013573 [Nothophytophthora sp. Chile5]|nr:hypothetical protein BBJ28_00013573 [Nothophytophthora sp. Chile5]
MVLALRPRHATFTPAQVCGFYFRPCRDEDDEAISEYFRCRCGTVRKQTRRNGYTNLMQHVRREHPDYEAVMLSASTAETGSMLNYVRRSALNVFGWLDWIVKNNLPLHFCENPAARRYSNLDQICVETLLRAMERLTQIVERYIAAEMPERFGLILDGWSHTSEHFLAVFACYEAGGKIKTPLLCMAPLLNDEDDDLSARGRLEFLAEIQPRDFGKQLTQCLFVVGDNCSTLSTAPCPEGRTSRLTHAEKVALQPFRRANDDEAELELEVGSDHEGSFVEQLQKRRRLAAVEQRYDLIASIPPTSNIAERFFSVARTTYGQERHSLQPITLEMVLFLRQNSSYWTARTVDEATHDVAM